MAVHRAQWPEALTQHVTVRFRSRGKLVSVLSSVRPGPPDTEGDEGMGMVRGDSFLSSTSSHSHCSSWSDGKGDLHNVRMMLGHF